MLVASRQGLLQLYKGMTRLAAFTPNDADEPANRVDKSAVNNENPDAHPDRSKT